MRKVAIVGSRRYADLGAVRTFVETLPLDAVVISGGARGVDTAAVDAAKARGLAVEVFPADWSQGLGAGFARNHTIVQAATEVVAFWDGESRGTAHTIRTAQRNGKPVTVITPGPS